MVPKISLTCKFPSLLDLPPTYLEWSASFFGLFLYRGQFHISLSELLRFQTHNQQVSIPSVPTKNWHLPSPSTRIKSWAAAAADLQHPVKGVKSGGQELSTFWRKTGRLGLQMVRYFQEILWAQFLHLFISRKAIKLLTVTPAPGFPCGAVVKNLLANAGVARAVGSIPGSGRFPGVGNGNPLQYCFFFF